MVLLNDSANAEMTIGLTINQAANDDDILSLKSSDVAHGMTINKETDTFASMSKVAAASGGLQIETFTEDTEALWIKAASTVDDTAKTPSGGAVIVLDAYKKNSTNRTVTGANANLVSIMNAAGSVFLFDAEGSAHADVEWTTFDAEDDLLLVADVEREMLPERFGQAVAYTRDRMESLGIIGKDSWHEEGGKTHAMVNWTRLAMLHHGALVQVAERLAAIENGLKALEAGA
jgi:hypothetical protein